VGTSLERRIGAIEAQRRAGTKRLAEMTDRDLLAVAVPSYTGPMPSDGDLPAFLARHCPELIEAQHDNA